MTQQKIITILLNLVVIVFFTLGFYLGNKYSKDAELIKEQRNTINRQRNLIELLERNKDRLRITRAEFESAVKTTKREEMKEKLILKINATILKDKTEMASIFNANDMGSEGKIVQIRMTEDGKGLNLAYGDRWLILRGGEITEYKVHMKEIDGKRKACINNPIEQI